MTQEPYVLITADTHAGGSHAQYREYSTRNIARCSMSGVAAMKIRNRSITAQEAAQLGL